MQTERESSFYINISCFVNSLGRFCVYATMAPAVFGNFVIFRLHTVMFSHNGVIISLY
jgi:hypothetical protein